jgi:thiol-disulfide isomerase/thioredoxin
MTLPTLERPAEAVREKRSQRERGASPSTWRAALWAVLSVRDLHVYFWAPSCAPCDVFTPTYDASPDKHPDIVHVKVNFETEQELVGVAQVRLLPTLTAFRKGNLVFKQGASPMPR